MGTESSTDQIPTVDFSGLDLNDPGTPAWAATRAQVRQAIDSVGTFIVGFDQVTPELLDELFGPVAESLFSLPLHVKQSNNADKPFAGYRPRTPASNFESLSFQDMNHLDSVQAFTKLMWPQGNPSFCDTVWSVTKRVSELQLLVWRMVLESLGVGQYYDSHAESMRHWFRMSEYLSPEDQEASLVLGSHTDINLVTIVYQHQSDGLEILSKGGQWLHSPPNTFTIIFGEIVEALSNGRVKPTAHRVRLTCDETRYSVLLGFEFNEDYVIQAPEELVDEEHRAAFKPFRFPEYLRYRFSDHATLTAKHPLKDFCGMNGDDVAA